MEEFGSHHKLAQALKNALIIHALVIVFLFFYYNPPHLFDTEKPQEPHHEQAQVIIQTQPPPKTPQQALPTPPPQPVAVSKAPPVQLPPQARPLTLAQPTPQPPVAAQAKPAPAAKSASAPAHPHLAQATQGTAMAQAAAEAAHEETAQELSPAEKSPLMFDTAKEARIKHAKPRSFADLARGFIEHMNEENAPEGDGMSSQARAEATVQRIIHDNYHAKVYGLIKQAVNAERPQLYVHNTTQEQSTLQLQIARNGKLLAVRILHPCQENRAVLGTIGHDLYSIEETLNRIAKSVGLYPPIPAAYKEDTITISFPFGISTQQGFYSYYMT